MVLGQLAVLLDVFLQIAVAYLLDDVVVMTALHHVEHLHDVLRFYQLQDLDFREKGRF